METLQDTIQFALIREGVVINNTIRVTATLQGMILPGTTEDLLRADLHGIVQRFISNVEWQFSNTNRRSHGSGLEEITVTATTRAPGSEHYSLDERAKSASPNAGLKLVNVAVDTNPPAADIQAAEQKLRLAILDDAQKEAALVSSATQRDYRVGKIDFLAQDPDYTSNRRPMVMAMSASANVDMVAGAASEIGNTMKLTLRGAITLRAHPRSAA